ncbi:MAG: hypothetical protein ACFHWX_09215 [Bacteroidota bacterium]
MNRCPGILLALYPLLLLPGLFGCESSHELKLNQQLLSDQLELIADMGEVYELRKQRINQTFVRNYLGTREHVTYSTSHIYLADTSKFGRINYQDYKNLALTGTELLKALEEFSEAVSSSHESTYTPDENDRALLAKIQSFADGYLVNLSGTPSQEETMTSHLKQLAKAAPILLYLGHLEALKLLLTNKILEMQQQAQMTTIKDYFTQLSPFLFIPEAERILISPDANHIEYSGRIYAIDRYDANQGLYIKSVSVNGQTLDYNPDNPQYRFTLPVVKNADDSMRIYLEAKAITHEGVDTTLTIERKFRVCP